MSGARELGQAREAAEEALAEYARLAFRWNAPDHEYTRRSIRHLAERAINDHDPRPKQTATGSVTL